MIDIAELRTTQLENTLHPVQQSCDTSEMRNYKRVPDANKFSWLKQLVQFGLVGGLNTLLDILLLNTLLLLFPTTSTTTLLAYNALAFSLGAVNSFFLNKYWTFKHKQGITLKEVSRFSLTTLCGIAWSTLVLWIASTALHPHLINATLWANSAKMVSVASSAVLSYAGMRLWVFIRPSNT